LGNTWANGTGHTNMMSQVEAQNNTEKERKKERKERYKNKYVPCCTNQLALIMISDNALAGHL